MFSVYALYSEKINRIYVGQTDDLEERVADHRSGRSRYTSRADDWVLIHVEEFATRAEAMRRERELKTHRGRDFLREKLRGIR